jgi:photosystem II stability/assembly factor-like uncharacterized protein
MCTIHKIVIVNILIILSLLGESQNVNWYLYSAPRQRQLHDISFQTRENLVVVGGHPFNDSITYMGHSINSGKEWSRVLDLYPGKMQKAVLFTSEMSGISVGVNESLYKTSNGGQTWVEDVFELELNNRNIYTIFKGNSSVVFAAGGLDSQNGFFLKSNDNGNLWEMIYQWDENEIYSGTINSENKLVVCGPNGFIQTSYNNGLSWDTPIIEESDYSPTYKDVIFINDTIAYCVGGKIGEDSSSIILRTIDGGDNWNIVYHETAPCLNAIEKVTDSVLYAAGDYGRILKSNDTGLTWINQEIDVNPGQDIFAIDFFNEHIGGFSGRWGNVIIYYDGYYDYIPQILMPETSVYPNPARDIIFCNDELLNASIIDINGRLIKSHKGKIKSINVSDFATGTYVIVSDNYKSIKIQVK